MTILSQSEIMVKPNCQNIYFIVLTMLMIGSWLIPLIKGNLKWFLFTLPSALLIVFIMDTAINSLPEQATGRYEYEVILDDDYPVKELYENYKVIDIKYPVFYIEDKKEEMDHDHDQH